MRKVPEIGQLDSGRRRFLAHDFGRSSFEPLGEVVRPWRRESIKAGYGRERAMKFQEIRDMAKGMGIKKYNNMKKVDLIRAIQKAENNMDCYGTQRVDSCQEETCAWRSDCLTLNSA
jgi:uncharacterized protein (DUF2147 family)